jgi:2-polyprenyl-3-methyl-5-hydroxy-6-metoxy-1,4-benzoquinol methylase
MADGTTTTTVDDVVEQLMSAQPTRSGKKRPERRFDKTQLKSSHHGRYVHRDYAAHFFRWGWVARHIARGARILDVGCGQELPLMWVLSGNMSVIPSRYVGVDLNEVPFTGSPAWAKIIDQTSFVDRGTNRSFLDIIEGFDPNLSTSSMLFDVITNFEVIEHMMPEDGLSLLKGFVHWLKPQGRVYLSTPVFDGHAAVNHVHEYTIPELQALIESAGLEVEHRHGTFASANDIKKAASKEDYHIYKKLADYYGGDVMSTFLAPLYPDASRNNLWILKLPTPEKT